MLRIASCCLNCKNLPHLLQVPTTYRASTISFCYPANIKFKHIKWLLIGLGDCCGRKNSLASVNSNSIGRDHIFFWPILTSNYDPKERVVGKIMINDIPELCTFLLVPYNIWKHWNHLTPFTCNCYYEVREEYLNMACYQLRLEIMTAHKSHPTKPCHDQLVLKVMPNN